MKFIILVLMILSLVFCLHSEEASALATAANPATAAVAVKDGYALLNSLLTLFENMPAEKGFVEVDNRLSQLGMDVKAASEAGLIDKIFYHRYQRMLTIYKMVVTPVIKGELLKDLFMRAFDDFVWAVTYEHWTWGAEDSIPKMAAAMEEEFVQLQFYLDSRQAREEFKKKIGNRILPPPPAKKKSENK